jgi:uncharacterized protein (TIGR00369 family)
MFLLFYPCKLNRKIPSSQSERNSTFMKYAVRKKQNNSKMCFVCGLKNDFGLHASFYETEAKELVALISPSEQHQGYPGRMHGGIAAAILDETMGRAICNEKEKTVWSVTLELTTKFRKPIPLDGELKVVGRVVREGGRFYESSGEIILPDGGIAVSATGKFMKIDFDSVTSDRLNDLDWFMVENPDDPAEIEIPREEAG